MEALIYSMKGLIKSKSLNNMIKSREQKFTKHMDNIRDFLNSKEWRQIEFVIDNISLKVLKSELRNEYESIKNEPTIKGLVELLFKFYDCKEYKIYRRQIFEYNSCTKKIRSQNYYNRKLQHTLLCYDNYIHSIINMVGSEEWLKLTDFVHFNTMELHKAFSKTNMYKLIVS
jgi:intracellular sulfur oxidation DsrE/DsrF family protein